MPQMSRKKDTVYDHFKQNLLHLPADHAEYKK